MSGPQFAQSFNADDQTVVSFESIGDAVGRVEIGVGVIGNKCGVHGESIGNSLGTRAVPEGTGVHGRGEATGVHGDGGSVGVLGSGTLRGVYGVGQNRFNEPENTTGVLGEGYKEASGVIGLNFLTDNRSELGQRAGVLGASNANSENDQGAGVVGLSLKGLPHLIDTPEPLPLPDLKKAPSGDGTGVWGASGGGTGVHGQSQSGRGGVFESREVAQINLKPVLNHKLPINGQVGDLLVLQNNPGTPDELVEFWFCSQAFVPAQGTNPARNAGWRLVQLGSLVTA